MRVAKGAPIINAIVAEVQLIFGGTMHAVTGAHSWSERTTCATPTRTWLATRRSLLSLPEPSARKPSGGGPGASWGDESAWHFFRLHVLPKQKPVQARAQAAGAVAC